MKKLFLTFALATFIAPIIAMDKEEQEKICAEVKRRVDQRAAAIEAEERKTLRERNLVRTCVLCFSVITMTNIVMNSFIQNKNS